MRILYSFFLYLIIPFIPFYLKRRGRKNPDYNKHWNERFGFSLIRQSTKPIIWIHAVSVGETRATTKLIALLTEKYYSINIGLIFAPSIFERWFVKRKLD